MRRILLAAAAIAPGALDALIPEPKPKPKRIFTHADAERIEKAEAKRARKAAKRAKKESSHE